MFMQICLFLDYRSTCAVEQKYASLMKRLRAEVGKATVQHVDQLQ